MTTTTGFDDTTTVPEIEWLWAFLDFACTDRGATVAAHVAAGARVVAEHPGWTVMEDPVGRVYCCTDRDPRTGQLA